MELQSSITAEERKIARNWYFWLWFSPVVAFPTAIALGAYAFFALSDLADTLWVAIPVFGAALWHLILLIPALDKRRPFVRWHGRQAMLIVAVRTGFLFLYALLEEIGYYRLNVSWIMLFSAIALWFFGTLWGQLEANGGKCTLDKWFGRREPRAFGPAKRELGLPEDADVQAWVEIVRCSQDPQERARALQALEQLGLTEQL